MALVANITDSSPANVYIQIASGPLKKLLYVNGTFDTCELTLEMSLEGTDDYYPLLTDSGGLAELSSTLTGSDYQYLPPLGNFNLKIGVATASGSTDIDVFII